VLDRAKVVTIAAPTMENLFSKICHWQSYTRFAQLSGNTKQQVSKQLGISPNFFSDSRSRKRLKELAVEWFKRKRTNVDFNQKLKTLSVLYLRQCSAIAAQRIVRSVQIALLYHRLYNRRCLLQVIEKFQASYKSCHNKTPLYFLFSAALFSWDKEKIRDEEIDEYASLLFSVTVHNNVT